MLGVLSWATQTLLERITAFRVRLEATPTLATENEPEPDCARIEPRCRSRILPASVATDYRGYSRLPRDRRPRSLPIAARRLLATARELLGRQPRHRRQPAFRIVEP